MGKGREIIKGAVGQSPAILMRPVAKGFVTVIAIFNISITKCFRSFVTILCIFQD